MKTKIALFDAKAYDIESFNSTNREFGFDIKYFENRLSDDTVSLAKGFNVVCAFVNDTMDAKVIDVLKESGIDLIALRSAGYNNVDLKASYNNIHVVRVPAYSPYTVAEHAVALMLTLNRKTHKAFYRTRDNNFTIKGLLGFEMHGKTAGIIGTGKIGKCLVKILKGFGMEVLAYDKFPDEQFAKEEKFEYVDLDTLFNKSDIISLHCPLTKETFHLINVQTMAKMKAGVMIINTGRGKLIDTKALIEEIKSQKIGSAGLDVYEEESEYFFEDFSATVVEDDTLARLLSFTNVLVTAHQGFFTKEALATIAHTTLQNIKDYFADSKLENEICYKCDEKVCVKQLKGRCF
ncbi:MAG: 2-hydroxyacid dehydrogenase [Candidatus Margulisiibacteriota bacterium]|nr:MAG: 2-hydroxyacid dehydrogenase [Candidatus Margulisiibacteriota bacterium]HAR63514.1 hydroxyacid dehydrogenase [Candidatus Margulisiibacteriota bacterium]HCT86092.1 hydroxyacid dehydrogenase [Candidatus Margulisiibacteriota bacterium]HCY38081.1 hydroxyacid dehydrogenase [Candidatus Margulisiibacteriota bacterium]